MVRFPRVKFNFVDMWWSRQSRIKLPPFYTLPPLIQPKTVLVFWWYHTSDAHWSVFWSHKSISDILYPSPMSQPHVPVFVQIFFTWDLDCALTPVLFHLIQFTSQIVKVSFFMAWMLFCPILNWLTTTSVKTELVGEEFQAVIVTTIHPALAACLVLCSLQCIISFELDNNIVKYIY